MRFDLEAKVLRGEHGELPVPADDQVTRKLAMLIEGECEGAGPTKAAKKFGFTKQRYFQIRQAFAAAGAQALIAKPRGPKRNYRRTDELVRQVIRHRFLDPKASVGVIAQKLRQSGMTVSTRSVERVIADDGLRKKTLPAPPSS